MKSHNHLLIFLDSYLTVIRIGGIASLGNVVVLGIVAPVEAAVGILLLNRSIVVGGKKMNVVYAKLNEIINTDRYAVLVYKALLGEGKIFTLILSAFDLVGEVSDMDLPDDSIGVAVNTCIEPSACSTALLIT